MMDPNGSFLRKVGLTVRIRLAQRRVCLSSEPLGCLRKAPEFGGGLRVTGDVRRDVQGTSRRALAVFL